MAVMFSLQLRLWLAGSELEDLPSGISGRFVFERFHPRQKGPRSAPQLAGKVRYGAQRRARPLATSTRLFAFQSGECLLLAEGTEIGSELHAIAQLPNYVLGFPFACFNALQPMRGMSA